MGRILLIAGSQSRIPSLAASSVQVMRMAAALAGLGHAVTLFVPRGRGDLAGLEAPDLGAFYGVPVRFAIERRPAPGRGRWAEMCYAAAAHQFAASTPWDVILSRNPLATVLLARAGITHTFEAHHVRLAGRVDRWLATALRSPYVERIVVIAGTLVPELARLGVPAEKILVAPDAADAGHPPSDSDPASNDLRTPARPKERDPFVCVYAGSLSALKGMGTLLAAARRLPEMEFLVVGGIPADALAAHRITAGANVRFTGAVPPVGVPALLRTADVLVLPHGVASASRYLSPLKLFEYLAAGRPIVASDLPALREVLRQGENALLVPPDDAGALAAAIGRLRADPELCARLAQEATATAQHYTWRRRAETVLAGLPVANPSRLAIGHLLNSFHPRIGGAERQAAALAREQVADGHEVHVITRQLPALPALDALDGVTIHRLPAGRLGALAFVAAGVRFIHARRRPFDVLHAHQARANAALGLLARGLGGPPLVIKVAGLDVPQRGPGDRARAAMLRRADAVVALTASMRAELAAMGVPEARLHVIPNGVDGAHHHPATASERALARAALGLDSRAPVVLFLGRLTAVKGPDLLLDAWADLTREDGARSAILLIAGDGPLAPALGERARGFPPGAVRFLGAAADPAPLYHAADVLALPSRSEGLSNTLLEAMASGLAIVATDVGGNREVLTQGETGRLIAPEPHAFARALAEILADPALRAAMGEAASSAARRLYDLRAIARRYEELYRSVAATRRGAHGARAGQ